MGGFNMMSLMSNVTQSVATKPKYESKILPLEDIIPNPANIYSIDGIDELADSILIAGRVLQNIVVKSADQDGKYMIISGHRRYLASKKLVEAGHEIFNTIPALVENEADENMRELMLIYTNSTARILTDAEKMQQAQRTTEILRTLKSEGKFEGQIRKTVARMLDTTETQLARYAAIAKNLTNTKLQEAFIKGEIGVSAAYESSGLSKKGQAEIADKLNQEGAVTIHDVTDIKEREKKQYKSIKDEYIPEKPSEEDVQSESGADAQPEQESTGISKHIVNINQTTREKQIEVVKSVYKVLKNMERGKPTQDYLQKLIKIVEQDMQELGIEVQEYDK